MTIPTHMTGALSENLLCLMAFSDEHGKMIARMTDPQLFEGDLRVIAERVIGYWRTEKQAPKNHTFDLFADIAEDRNNKRSATFRRTLSAMLQLSQGINAPYVVSQLKTFKRMQTLKDAVFRSAEVLNQAGETTIHDVETILADILKARDCLFDSGVSLGKDFDVLLDHLKVHDCEFSSGIPVFDKYDIAPARGSIFVLLGASGVGKCLGRGTPVLTYESDIVDVESIRQGDRLMGPDSRPRNVLSTNKGHGPLYRIIPVKGDPWVCNDVHVLTVVSTVTGQIIDIPLNDFLLRSKSWQKEQELFTPAASLQFDLDNEGCPDDPNIDPYFLGLWIGDGTKRLYGKRAEVSVSKPDSEVLEACKQVAATWGLTVNVGGQQDNPTIHLVRTLGTQKGNRLLQAMRDLFSNEYGEPWDDNWGWITSSMRVASEDYRRNLLAGLIDSDGHLDNNCVEIVQKDTATAEGISFLARSLGLRVTAREKVVNEVSYVRLVISGNLVCIPTRIPRKTATTRQQIKSVNRTGFIVESIGVGDYFGFTLDGDGRFLLGDFTVTHNTWGMVHLGRQAWRRRKKVLHITPEISAEHTMMRYYMMIFGASKRSAKSKATLLELDDKRLIGMRQVDVKPVFDFQRSDVREELMAHIARFNRSMDNIRIKRFAPREVSVDGLRRLLDSMEDVEGFAPDLMIVDSAYLLKLDESLKEHRHKLGRSCEGLRAIAVDRNIAVAASYQLSKKAVDARRASYTHIAEDFSIIQTADVAVTHSATKAEQKYGLARLYADKVRSDQGNVAALVTQNYATGAYVLNSIPLEDQDEYQQLARREFGADFGGREPEEEED